MTPHQGKARTGGRPRRARRRRYGGAEAEKLGIVAAAGREDEVLSRAIARAESYGQESGQLDHQTGLYEASCGCWKANDHLGRRPTPPGPPRSARREDLAASRASPDFRRHRAHNIDEFRQDASGVMSSALMVPMSASTEPAR